MGLEKVHHEANLKALKVPSPSPHPVPTVRVERIITEHWNSWGEGKWGMVTLGYKYQQPNSELLGWGEQQTNCSLPLKTQNNRLPEVFPQRKFLFSLEMHHQPTPASTTLCKINRRCQGKWLGGFKSHRLVPAKIKNPARAWPKERQT